MSIKNSNDTIGNRTRDLLACSVVIQLLLVVVVVVVVISSHINLTLILGTLIFDYLLCSQVAEIRMYSNYVTIKRKWERYK